MNAGIIVAAGKGVRMSGAVKKQYLPLAGQPILSRTLGVFALSRSIHVLYLVIPESDMAFCREQILNPLDLDKDITLVPGGSVRQESVYNGLCAIQSASAKMPSPVDVVAIHDGVRPFITSGQIDTCVDVAASEGACIPGIPVRDTLKRVDGDGNVESTLTRETVWQAQTPQTFRFDLIFDAHVKAIEQGITATDDASLIEHLGGAVKMLPGSRYNMKITTPEDLKLAEAIYRQI